MTRLPTIDPIDGIALAGLLLLAFGVGLISVPAALIVVGVVLIVYAVLGAYNQRTPGGTST